MIRYQFAQIERNKGTLQRIGVKPLDDSVGPVDPRGGNLDLIFGSLLSIYPQVSGMEAARARWSCWFCWLLSRRLRGPSYRSRQNPGAPGSRRQRQPKGSQGGISSEDGIARGVQREICLGIPEVWARRDLPLEQ